MTIPSLLPEKRVLYYMARLDRFREQAAEAFREQQDRLKGRGLSQHQRWSARYSSPSFWASHRDYLDRKFREAMALQVKQTVSLETYRSVVSFGVEKKP